MSESDDNDDIQLRPDTLIALREFLEEKKERESKFKDSVLQDQKNCDIEFEENWQLSQFWYDDKTVSVLTRGIVDCTKENAKIALISCPTLYKQLVNIAGNRKVKLFEFDQRFSVYGSDYIKYDYNEPLNFPNNLQQEFDLVVCDPPFLSEECLTNVAETAKVIMKGRIVLCTGAVMSNLAENLLGVKKCNFEPHHKNNLANEFWCYANFNFDAYLDN